MANLGDMVVSIVGDMTGFSDSLTATQKKMAAFGINAAAIGVAVTKAAKMAADAVVSYTKYGSAIFDASQKTGLSTDAIQEWKFIAEQTGGTLENITGAVAMMTRGLATNAETFRQLGIETRNADGSFRSTTEIFNDTITTLSAMTDETERDQLAFKLLGRSAQTLIPILNAGAGGISAMRTEARNLGIVLDKGLISNADTLGDSLDALKAASEAYKNTLVNNVAPGLTTVVNGLKDFIQASNDAANVQKNLSDAQNAAAGLDQLRSAQRALEVQIIEREQKRSYVAARTPEFLKGYDDVTQGIRDQSKMLTQEIAEQKRLQEAASVAAKKTAELSKATKDVVPPTIAATEATQDFADILQQQYEIEMWSAIYLAENVEVTREWDDVITQLGDNSVIVTDKMTEGFIDWQAVQLEAIGTLKEAYSGFLVTLGGALGDTEKGWKDWGNVAIDAIGQVVIALGAQLAALSAIALFELRFGTAATLAGGAVAAVAAGTAIKNYQLAEGGIVQPQIGGVQATIAEAGVAEAVIPLDKLDRMLESRGNGSGGGDMTHLVVNLDSKPLLDKIFNATKNRTVLISSGAVV